LSVLFVSVLEGCGGIVVVVVCIIVVIVGSIVDVVREMGVSRGLWVVSPVVWGWRLALAGAMHVGVLGVGWASMLVVMVIMVLSS